MRLSGLVGNVDRGAVEAALSSCGRVTNVRFRKGGLAVVSFEGPEAARRALNKKAVTIAGFPATVDKMEPPDTKAQQQQQQSSGSSSSSLKIQPLPGAFQDEDLRNAVPSKGLESVRVVRREGRAVYGYANYSSRDDADAASRFVSKAPGSLGRVTCSVRAAGNAGSSPVRNAPDQDDQQEENNPSYDESNAFDYNYDDDFEENFDPPQHEPAFPEGLSQRTVVFNKPSAQEKVKEPSIARTVRVDTLPEDVDGKRLRNFFDSFGSVVAASIERPGLGLVVFDDVATAQIVVKEVDGIDAFMGGKPISCRILGGGPSVKPKAKASPLKAGPTGAAAKKRLAPPVPAAPPLQSAPPKPIFSFPVVDDASDSSKALGSSESKLDLVGQCEFMCPPDEIRERIRFKELDFWERPEGYEKMAGDETQQFLSVQHMAVKKYKRSDAGSVQNVPSIVRPPKILLKTFLHLAHHVMKKQRLLGSQDVESYLFLWDRCRAIRKDFILQNYTTGGKVDEFVIDVFESMARFFIVMERRLAKHPEWHDGISHGKHNAESLSETLTALLAFYNMAYKRSSSPTILSGEAEFTAYWLMFFADHEQGAAASGLLSRLALERPDLHAATPVQRAAQLRAARADGNYARFFRIARASPYVTQCLAASMFVQDVRNKAFVVLQRAYARSEALDVAHLQRLLCFDTIDEAADAATNAGLVVAPDRATCKIKPKNNNTMDDDDLMQEAGGIVDNNMPQSPSSERPTIQKKTGLFVESEDLADEKNLSLADVVLANDKAEPLFVDDGRELVAVAQLHFDTDSEPMRRKPLRRRNLDAYFQADNDSIRRAEE